MERVKITLEDIEFSALVRLAERELRPVPAQVRVIIREHLRRAGLLPAEKNEEAKRVYAK